MLLCSVLLLCTAMAFLTTSPSWTLTRYQKHVHVVMHRFGNPAFMLFEQTGSLYGNATCADAEGTVVVYMHMKQGNWQ